jgi:hypothetical protein
MRNRRLAFAIPTGFAAMFLTVSLSEFVSFRLFPLGAQMERAFAMKQANDPGADAAITAALPTVPTGAFVALIAGWSLGTLASVLVTATIAPFYRMQLAIGMMCVNLAAIGANLWLIPHPAWMPLPALLVPLAIGLAIAFKAHAMDARRANRLA